MNLKASAGVARMLVWGSAGAVIISAAAVIRVVRIGRFLFELLGSGRSPRAPECSRGPADLPHHLISSYFFIYSYNVLFTLNPVVEAYADSPFPVPAAREPAARA